MISVALYAKFQMDSPSQMDVTDKCDFVRFEFKMGLRGIRCVVFWS